MARDYSSQYQALLPSGAAWPRVEDSVATEFARGVTTEFGRVDARAAQLLLEMDPRTTTELIDDWERVTGLPDACEEPAPDTLETRRAAVTARFVARGPGGPSATLLKEIITALGYDADAVLIRRFHRQAFTCESVCNDSLNQEDAGWMYLWEIIAPHGDLDEQVECKVRSRYGLSHLAFSFAFPLFAFGDGSFSRAGSGVLTDPQTGDLTELDEDELGTFYFGV